MTYSRPFGQLNIQDRNRKIASLKTLLMSLIVSLIGLNLFSAIAIASDFNEPWRDRNKALILDAYELNSLEWDKIVKNPRIAGFINKATDGLSAEYCSDRRTLCGAKWRKYSVTKELYHTRRLLAKTLGLKWGSYHLGRAGNPTQQALHFIKFADPQPDEVIVLDIESMNSEKFISLEDAERFSNYVYKKLDRYPMLYTNHNTANFIAANRIKYPLLSRMKLWYARYKGDIRGTFPMGNWDKPALWQFAYGGNCNKKACPYRVKGTPNDIDVNVSPLSMAALKKYWPFDGLVDEKPFTDEEAKIIYVSNTVEYPEEEKHSDFVLDIDYVEPNLSDLAVAGIKPSASKAENAKCELPIEEIDSDTLEEC